MAARPDANPGAPTSADRDRASQARIAALRRGEDVAEVAYPNGWGLPPTRRSAGSAPAHAWTQGSIQSVIRLRV